MKEEYEPVGTVIFNKETIINSIEYIPKETCSEKFLGRCKKAQILEIEFCKVCQECEIPHKIVYINPVKEKK
jgi:hypothetical protein